jgi:hypothetical protein
VVVALDAQYTPSRKARAEGSTGSVYVIRTKGPPRPRRGAAWHRLAGQARAAAAQPQARRAPRASARITTTKQKKRVLGIFIFIFNIN